MNWRRLIPNSISSASLIFGVLSIFKTIEGDFFLAPVFIVIAVIFDSMDGRAARALGVGGGDFGKEMDSLCDMCSFGVAPAIMIYMYGLQELGLAGQVIAALFAACVWHASTAIPVLYTVIFRACLFRQVPASWQPMLFPAISSLRLCWQQLLW